MLPHAGSFLRPSWMVDFLRDGGMMKFPNVVIPGRARCRTKTSAPHSNVRPSLGRISAGSARLWGGPIVIKGVLTAQDAQRSIDAGAEAIVVSNHGGRQLDGVAPTLAALPEVVDAVAGRAEVYLDGGIRRGSDVVKALCLGARAVLVGRAYAYGLGAAGGHGVLRAIEILRSGVVRTLRLLGCRDVSALDRSYVEFSGRL